MDHLTGCWRLERAEGGIDASSPIEMDFVSPEKLDYCVLNGDQWIVMKLSWRIEGDVIVTTPSSSRGGERTGVRLEPDGSLVIHYDGARAWLRRAERRAPA